MRRLENEDEEKFWEAWVKDAVFYFRFGKIGSAGQTKVKRFKTDAEAEVELEEKLQEKLKHGFAEPGAKDDESSEGSDDEESHEDESEDEDEDSEDENEGDEAPKKPARKKAVAAAPAPIAAGPTLPARYHRHTPKPEQISAAKAAIDALSRGLGRRSWKVARLGRRARQALERVGGIDPHDHGALGQAFDGLMGEVLAAKKRLPLEIAMQLLFELDPKVFVRTVKHWHAHADSSAPDAIGVLQASAELGDAELSLHTAAALADRTLDARAWKRRFTKLKPHLEEALAKRGSSITKFCKTLHTDDKTLHAHVEEMAR